MLLVSMLACWQPEPYVPPEAPVEEPAAEEEAEPAEAPAEQPDEEAPAEEAPEDPEEVEAPPFRSYPARTVQAPVTVVDDWGKPLAVLGSAGWELEVRGEDTVRTRVWCGTCSPPVEGWIQAHLIERTR